MKHHRAHRRSALALALAGLVLAPAMLPAQTPRGLSPQDAAVAQLENAHVDLMTAAGTARSELTFAVYSDPTNTAQIKAKSDALIAAEKALAAARGTMFAETQASAAKLSAEHVDILVWQAVRPEGGRRRTLPSNFGGGGGRGGQNQQQQQAQPTGDGFAGLGGRAMNFGGGPTVVSLSDIQQTEITRLDESAEIAALRKAAVAAKRAVYAQVYSDSKDENALAAKYTAWSDAESKLALARAAAFAKFQATSAYKLNDEQVKTLATGMTGGRGGL